MVKHLGSEFQIGHRVSFSESNVLSRASMSHRQLTTMDSQKDDPSTCLYTWVIIICLCVNLYCSSTALTNITSAVAARSIKQSIFATCHYHFEK